MPTDGGFRIDGGFVRGGLALLDVHGDLDLHVAPELRERITAVIDEGTSSLLLDLSGVTFVDSMALGVILGGMKRLRAKGGRLRLVVPQQDVRRIFEITLLDHVLDIDPSRAAALTALGHGEGRA